jgi:hypothetical protein
MSVAAMPPQSPTIAIHFPSAGERPFFIASSSIQPTIAAGIPANGPQQKKPATAKPSAAIAFWLDPVFGDGGAFCPPTFGENADSGEAQFKQNAASAGFC